MLIGWNTWVRYLLIPENHLARRTANWTKKGGRGEGDLIAWCLWWPFFSSSSAVAGMTRLFGTKKRD